MTKKPDEEQGGAPFSKCPRCGTPLFKKWNVYSTATSPYRGYWTLHCPRCDKSKMKPSASVANKEPVQVGNA